MAIWDYYATFLTMAGVKNPTGDSNPLSPAPPDSVNLWPYWSGVESISPRQNKAIVLDHLMYSRNTTACYYDGHVQSMPCNGSGSLRFGDYKIIVGEIGFNGMFGHFSPNASFNKASIGVTGCSLENPCLFNVTKDMEENHDLSSSRQDDVKMMLEKFHAIDAQWHPPSEAPPDEIDEYCKVALENGGFAAPWRSGE